MLEFSDVAVAHAVQLAVAPVFLLTGIAAILSVMTNRLGRVIERARVLEERLEGASPESLATLRADLAVLSRRAKLNGRAITLCTTTALLVCCVIAVLFLSAFLRFDASIPVALLFIAAMLCFFLGLLWFLARDLPCNDESAHRTALNCRIADKSALISEFPTRSRRSYFELPQRVPQVRRFFRLDRFGCRFRQII